MENRISRRRFLAVSAAAGATAALSACGATATPTSAPPTATKAAVVAATAAPTVATKPLVNLVISFGQHPSQAVINDAPTHLEMNKLTNVKLDYQVVPDADWGAKMTLLLSTKQAPDLMRVAPANIRDYSDPSVLMPVQPLIDKYAPNLKKLQASFGNSLKKYNTGGQLYFVPQQFFNSKKLARMPCIRKDLVDKAGLKLPTTMDELYTVLKELKKANPSVVGYTGRNGIKYQLLNTAYPFGSGHGAAGAPYWEETANSGKGAWVFGPIQPEFKDVLAYYAKLFTEGLLDPDIVNSTADQWHQKNGSGKGIFSYENFTFCVAWNQAARGLDAKATWTPFPTIKGPRGARQRDLTQVGVSGYAIGANCKYPERAIEYLDMMATPIGIDLRSWGVQDVHYTLSGTRPATITDYSVEGLAKAFPPGSRTLKPELITKYKAKADPFRTYSSEVGIGRLDFVIVFDEGLTYLWDEPGEADAWYSMLNGDKALRPDALPPVFTAQENDKLKKITTDVNAIVDPAMDKLIFGKSTMADWDKSVADAIKAGAEDWAKIYNEAEARG